MLQKIRIQTVTHGRQIAGVAGVQLDCGNRAQHSHIGNVGMVFEFRKSVAMCLLDRCDPFEDGLGFKDPQVCDGGGTAQRVSRIRMSVKERAGSIAAVEHLVNLVAAHRGGKRQKTAGEAFRQTHQIRIR
jgi:hypothetical protein